MKINTLKTNQIVITDKGESTFLSYGTEIARINTNKKNNNLTFTKFWDYSQTTTKYLYQFLNDYKSDLSNNIYTNILNALKSNNKKQAFLKLIENKIIKVID